MSAPACRICGYREEWLGPHLQAAHNLTVGAYLEKFPRAPVVSVAAHDLLMQDMPKGPRRHPPAPESLRVLFGGVSTPVNPDVPPDVCLPAPDGYRVPMHGALAEDVHLAAIALWGKSSLFISGPSGTGKDAFVHAWSAWTRTPGEIFQMEPSADTRAWFFSREFNEAGTRWEDGILLQRLRDGYLTESGRRVPYLILITDFDRATPAQAEGLRLVADTIQGRVKGPHGVTYQVLPGTRIVATANTQGGGDERGLYRSARPIDSSILSRFNTGLIFSQMDWKDEEPVVRDKFPGLVARAPTLFPMVGAATAALRAGVASRELFGDFSHRELCGWLHMANLILDVEAGPNVVLSDRDQVSTLLTRAFRVVRDKYPDEISRAAANRLVSPHISRMAKAAPKPRR